MREVERTIPTALFSAETVVTPMQHAMVTVAMKQNAAAVKETKRITQTVKMQQNAVWRGHLQSVPTAQNSESRHAGRAHEKSAAQRCAGVRLATARVKRAVWMGTQIGSSSRTFS